MRGGSASTGGRSPGVILLISGLVLCSMLFGLYGISAVSSQAVTLRSHLIDGDIPESAGDPRWQAVPPMTIPLSGQVITRPVWPEPSVRTIAVRSVHNGSDIAFLLEWQDNTQNDKLTPGVFRDGVAIALPLGNAPAFFCMGQLDHYLNIWHWKADWQSDIDRRKAKEQERGRQGGVRRFEVIPRRPSSVEDLIGGGFSTLTSKMSQGRVQGDGEWEKGFWRVVMRRPLKQVDPENEARLEPGWIQSIAFAVWNGENQERNGQKAIAPWLQLSIEPRGDT